MASVSPPPPRDPQKTLEELFGVYARPGDRGGLPGEEAGLESSVIAPCAGTERDL